jgi:hypothetical protein
MTMILQSWKIESAREEVIVLLEGAVIVVGRDAPEGEVFRRSHPRRCTWPGGRRVMPRWTPCRPHCLKARRWIVRRGDTFWQQYRGSLPARGCKTYQEESTTMLVGALVIHKGGVDHREEGSDGSQKRLTWIAC